jgi:hypothetical protein
MKLRTLSVCGLIITSLAIGSRASAAESPSVDAILAKYINALGGKTAMEKVNSRSLKIKIESEALGLSEGEILNKAPNKQWLRIELAGGAGTMNEGYDGTVGWAKNPWEGLRVKSGDELAKAKRDAEFQKELKLKTVYPGLAYKATEKVGEEEAYLLESKPSASSSEKLWLSVKSGLLLRQESNFEGPQGAVNAVTTPQEYKETDGLKHPSQLKMKFSSGGQTFEFTMKVTEIKYNVPIENSKFAKPAE